jgi:hypothetical protein
LLAVYTEVQVSVALCRDIWPPEAAVELDQHVVDLVRAPDHPVEQPALDPVIRASAVPLKGVPQS